MMQPIWLSKQLSKIKKYLLKKETNWF